MRTSLRTSILGVCTNPFLNQHLWYRQSADHCSKSTQSEWLVQWIKISNGRTFRCVAVLGLVWSCFVFSHCRFAVATPEELAVNNDDCAICWDSMQTARKLPCGHLFHKYVSGEDVSVELIAESTLRSIDAWFEHAQFSSSVSTFVSSKKIYYFLGGKWKTRDNI